MSEHWGFWRFARESRRYMAHLSPLRFLARLPDAWQRFAAAQAADEAKLLS